MPKLGLISLGCAKNLVDSEHMLARLRDAGWEITEDMTEADVGVVNTCGFIEAAKTEAIETILETAQNKQTGNMKGLVVTGCLVQRYADEMRAELPEIDVFCGTGSYDDIVDAANAALKGQQAAYMADMTSAALDGSRDRLTPSYTAYFKIAEGCSNTCAYCIIPKLRGRYRSREMASLLEEARALSDAGVKELIVIAQDITRWGMDLYGKPSLALLLRELAKIDGIRWIRLHYLYPEIIDDELIDLIANEDKIVKYLDIPIQHINNDILRRMNRHCTGDEIRALLQKLRARIPGLVLRTSLITGLPGEGEAEFEELCTWLREVRLERVGVFPFSPEEGTPAAVMTDRCEPDEAQRRADLILELQAGIMDDYNAACIGRDMTVLCEHRARSGMCSGRTYADSPEIDGTVYFTGAAQPGDMVTVHITGCDDGDLAGEQIHE